MNLINTKNAEEKFSTLLEGYPLYSISDIKVEVRSVLQSHLLPKISVTLLRVVPCIRAVYF